MKVFYSWQSDLDNKYNRNFIKDCLIKAIKKLNRELNLIESIRIDHDTLGVAGSPDITNTILSKIDESNIFIGDISFLGKVETGKYCSNPNVLIELGYALSSLTDICIINVMNTSYGEPKDNLPFDLAHKRWPITYKLNKENIENKVEIKNVFVKTLEDAMEPILSLRQSNQEPVSLIEQPSVDNINSHILSSDPKMDWHINNTDIKKNSYLSE